MKSCLQFSGGKDSLALLWHSEALWECMDVIWLDTGDSYPQVELMMDDLKHKIPNFIHLKADVPKYRRQYGNPTSQNWTSCCLHNIWQPIHAYVQQNGYNQILRGTKRCDPYLHTIHPGDVIGGILYTMPLWEWTEKDVEKYLGDRLPEAYKKGAVGMPDCRGCTAVEACGVRTKHLWS